MLLKVETACPKEVSVVLPGLLPVDGMCTANWYSYGLAVESMFELFRTLLWKHSTKGL